MTPMVLYQVLEQLSIPIASGSVGKETGKESVPWGLGATVHKLHGMRHRLDVDHYISSASDYLRVVAHAGSENTVCSLHAYHPLLKCCDSHEF